MAGSIDPMLLSPFSGSRGASFTQPAMWCPHYPMLDAVLARQTPGFVLDVGSLDGSDAIRFARGGHRVWSFEPSPGKIAAIRQRIKANHMENNVTLYPYALSNTTEIGRFFINLATGSAARKLFRGLGSAQDSLGAPLHTAHKNMTTVVSVPVHRLDELMPADQHTLLLKVDTQGFDLQVLLGARELLARNRVDAVVAEMAPALMPGGAEAAKEMVRFMNEVGYTCTRCCECSHCCGGGSKARTSIPALQYATDLAEKWDDIVCVSNASKLPRRSAPDARPE